MAIASGSSGNLLERQNELLRICAYLVWRKESSKSASSLTLHFFHGYTRSEVAEMARLPIAAIYNKLKDARSEIKRYSQGSGKLQVLARGAPPRPTGLVTAITSAELFTRIRNTIFAARISQCLPEEALLDAYRQPKGIPVPCSLLAHITSCERCLLVVDNYFQRPVNRDRGPLDGLDTPGQDSGSNTERSLEVGDDGATYRSMMRLVRRRRHQAREHRPTLLLIAVNGSVSAFHDIQGQRSSLFSRIEASTVLSFVEVFSEQQVRLAQLTADELPRVGDESKRQRVLLSDDRWLELTLRRDDVGLQAEAVYFDPALAAETGTMAIGERTSAHEVNPSDSKAEIGASIYHVIAGAFAQWRERLSRQLPVSALRWAVALICISSLGLYVAKHSATPVLSSRDVLNRAADVEVVDPASESEHQSLRIERLTASGLSVQQGRVETWKDGNGKRYVRHLYSAENQLLASEWQTVSGQRFTTVARPSDSLAVADRTWIESGLWKREISPRAFRASAVQNAPVTITSRGYEVTSAEITRARPVVLSETLILTREFHLSEERLLVREGAGLEQVRFVQTAYSKVASASVPDSTFRPDVSTGTGDRGRSIIQKSAGEALPGDDTSARLMRVQIAVLYELSQLGADVGTPIAVDRTPTGHIRLTGTVASEQRRAEIEARLRALPDHGSIENRLLSAQRLLGTRLRPMPSPPTRIYQANTAEPAVAELLRRHFESGGLLGSARDMAVLRFSADALEHAQRALQSAYALDRLGSVLTEGPANALNPASRREWAEMVNIHTGTVRDELQALRSQLQVISSTQSTRSDPEKGSLDISSPAQFTAAATELRKRVQAVNAQVGETFAGVSSENNPSELSAVLNATLSELPVRRAAELSRFAAILSRPEGLHKNDEAPETSSARP